MSIETVSAPMTAVAGLDEKQAGHLRHIRNLLNQPPGDWSFMLGRGPGQDDEGALRYQLGHMAYVLALTHYHRLPAAPGAFKPLFEKVVEKLLHPDVWLYWHDTSTGGAVFNKHLSHTLEPTWDPMLRDNIMYSAYVHTTAVMYNYLFQDDRYAQPGALTVSHYTPLWGEEHTFEYDQKSLGDHIYWMMAQNGFLGVTCEPNCIFLFCNQPVIHGIRFRDLVEGTSVAEQVVRDYTAAWERYGLQSEDGHFLMFLLQDSRTPVPNSQLKAGQDGGVAVMMSAWNREFVREQYERQIKDFVEDSGDGRLQVRFAKAPTEVPEPGTPDVLLEDTDFGLTTMWTSEMGDMDRRDRLFAHIDTHMDPTWYKGGLYYPRNDEPQNADGARTLVAPIEGNLHYAWARLTVPDGIWKLYNEPWGPEHYTDPALTSVGEDVDVTMAYVDPATGNLHFAVRRHPDARGDGHVTVSNIASKDWTLRPENDDALTLTAGRDVSVTRPGFEATYEDGQLRLALIGNDKHDFVLERSES